MPSRRPPRSSLRALHRLAAWALVLPMLGLPACGGSEPERENQEAVDLQARKMQDSETLLLKMNATKFLGPLGKSAEDFKLPDGSSQKLFEDAFTYTDVTAETTVDRYETADIAVRRWTVDPEVRTGDRKKSRMYQAFFEEVDYFKKAKFKIYLPVPTWVKDQYPDEWKFGMLFDAKAKMKNGKLAVVRGLAHVSWRAHTPASEEADIGERNWKIYDWKTIYLQTTEVDDYLFEEVLDVAIPDSATLARARRSLHEEKVLDYLLDSANFDQPHEYFRPEAFDRHPSVSIVDIDRDGFDDFFVGERWGKCMLFRNNGDGTFTDVAPQYGLDLDGDVQATLFADFDNDGDTDALVARHLQRSRYYVNEGGKFVDKSEAFVSGGELPYLGSSLAAADYDGDGLLDVYLATYAGDLAQRALNYHRNKGRSKSETTLMKPFLPKDDWKTLDEMLEAAGPTNDFFTNRPGPPNVLLRNLGGGKFEIQAASEASRFFRNTYQATWADYDADGDPDIYCANDFSPNYLYRNNGDGTFTNATEETGTADIGFGMGAGWGDYDGDGRQDLYVANMFSKAGRRVTSFFEKGRENYDPEVGEEGIDPMFRRMAEGNSLFRNVDGQWEKVSGMPAEERWDLAPTGKMAVEEGGWSWGGQFCDFDNDSWLDLYTLSGYYTAPKEARVDVDL